MSMAGELLIGAVGGLIEELLKGILDLSERTIDFKSVLEDFRSHLKSLSYVMMQLDELSDFLDCRENTNNLRELINKGNQLILKCDTVKRSILKYPKAPFYTKRLRNFDSKLHRASHDLVLQLIIQHMRQQVMASNCRCSLHSIVDKIKRKVKRKLMGSDRCCRDQIIYVNHASAETWLPLKFYDNEQLEGPNYADRLLGVAVEYMKGDSEEGVGRRFEERIKVLGEDRYEKIFSWTFKRVAGEKLQNWFRCHFTDLSTTAAPLKGILYVSTEKLAFCSKKRIRHGKTNRSYLKVVIPFQLLKAVSPSRSPSGLNSYDEYMKVISVDNQVFQFMKFLNYNDAKMCLQEVPTTRATCSRCT